jgi:Fumarylacetoacetate (FAA) hydrolase family
LSLLSPVGQDATVADMITGPAAALSALAGFQPLDPGDLLLTATPGGTALQAPPAVIERMGDLLPTPLKGRVFFSRQERNPAYLKAGDVVTASIATGTGRWTSGPSVSSFCWRLATSLIRLADSVATLLVEPSGRPGPLVRDRRTDRREQP